MDINFLVNITSKAWSLDILSQLHKGTTGRQAALITATGAGRTALRHSLDHLIRLNLLERNPGHGHPLRPEFRLTMEGQRVAAVAFQVKTIGGGSTGNTLLRRTWTLPVLTLSHRPKYFKDIKCKLPKVTDRALSQSLKSLENCNWITREIQHDTRPPRPLYTAANEGAQISSIARAIAA